MTPIALLLLASASPVPSQGPAMPFTPGMIVTRSVRIRPGTYYAPNAGIPALTIVGNGITVDLRGVTLVGDTNRRRPDRFTGRGIQIEGGRRVTVRGATVRGYRIGILARNVTALHLLDNELSHNWRPRLYSGIEKESLADWLDYHQNEHEEWLRYGAGIYLEEVHGGEIRGNTVRQGMNGLLLTRSDSLRIWNNDFSWNSGLGVGLYRASANVIMHNRINFDVRGYSHGFYFRGQDSAGLLIYEQSCRNIVAFNSVTHGGDGLFLWAGQSTMDDGQGGANDNLFYGNDFSFAPTNGMEATFSRNAFINNRVEGNWHGLWGGYSFQSVVMGNRFSRNIEAIAIEHGQENRIVGNHFTDDTTAIHLWWNRVEPSDWGYPKFRDTRSRDYTILGNSFSGERVALRVENSQRVRGDGNRFRDVDTVARLAGDTSGWAMSAPVEELADVPVPREFVVRPLPGGMNAMTPEARRFGRERIIVDAWGPYDWQSPRLWPAGRSDARPMRLRVLGPPGRWRMIAHNGVASWSADSGRVGDTLVVVPASGREDDYRVELEYRGARVTTPFGETLPAGAPVRFEWSRFEPANRWQVRFIAWDSSAAPLDSTARLARAFNGPPVATLDTNRLDLTWYAPPRKSIPQSLLLTVAVDTVTLAPGSYRLRTIADDAVRVYLDGRLLLDDWVPGDSHVKEVPFTATGRHELRVEHVQVGGWYELRVDILRDTRDSSP